MYLIGPEDLIRESTASERLSALGIKSISDMEKLLNILTGEAVEEPMVVLDAGERADIFLTLNIIRKLKSGVNVYVLSQRKGDQDFAVEVFRSGADDIFFYSDAEEFADRLNTIYRGVKRNLGRSIAFVGAGTGATLLAVNTAWTIRQLYPDLSVCIVDYDQYKNDVAFRMGISDAQKMLTLQDLITEVYENRSFDLGSSLVVNKVSDISVIPSKGWNVFIPKYSEDQDIKVMSYIVAQNDVTIFNLGHCMDETFTGLLGFADRLYVVATQEVIPIKSTVNILALIKRMGRDAVTEVVVNRFKKEKDLPSLSTLGNIFGKEVSLTVPDDYRAVRASEYERRPLRPDDSSLMYSSIRSLAQHLMLNLARR